MPIQNNSATTLINYENYYEDLRKTFNFLAEQKDLPSDINSYLVAVKEAGGFNHEYYMEHMVTNGFELVLGVTQIPGADLSLIHTAIDYNHAYTKHNISANLEIQRQKVSAKLLQVITLLKPPENYIQALAHQTLINKINPFFCDAQHIEQFRNLRENMNANVNKFAHLSRTSRLEEIEQQNQQTYAMNSQILLHLENLKHVEVGIHNTQTNMAQRSDIQSILEKLNENEVHVDQSFVELLAVSQPTYEAVMKLVEYMELQQAEKAAELQAEQIEAQYQGLNSSFQFVGQLAALTGSKDLARVAGIAQAGLQVQRAISQIAVMGPMSLAMLNPISAIGMTVLSVFSLFNRAPNQTKILMRQLTQISNQIKELHREVIKGNRIINENLDFILRTIIEGLENLQHNVTITTKRKLNEIQSALSALSVLVKQGFQDVMLKELNQVISYVFDVKNDLISKTQIDEKIYGDKLRLLRDCIINNTTANIFTGAGYASLLDTGTDSAGKVIELLTADEKNHYVNLLGLLAVYADKHLKQSISDKKNIFHPEIWRIAVAVYCEFKSLFNPSHQYDSKAINLQTFKQQGEGLLNFQNVLRSEFLYQQLAIMRNLYNVALVQNIRLFLEKLPKHTVTDELNELTQQTPEFFPNMTCRYEMPKVLQGNNDFVEKTKNYFSTNFNKKLKDLKMGCSKEFVMAVTLGIGHFDCECAVPDTLGKKHHKHSKKFVLKSGSKVGLDINFVVNGKRIPLYRPSITKQKFRATQLPELYDHLLKNTEKVYTDTDCHYMRETIKQHILDRNKKLAQNIVSALRENPAYSELLKLNCFTLAYLTCAGFPESIIKKYQECSLLRDLTLNLEYYFTNGNEGSQSPSLKLLDSLGQNPLDEVIANLQNPKINKQENYFQESYAFQQVRLGLQCLYTLMLAEKCLLEENKASLQPRYISQNRNNIFVAAPPQHDLPLNVVPKSLNN